MVEAAKERSSVNLVDISYVTPARGGKKVTECLKWGQ